MSDNHKINLHYEVDVDDFSSAGEASGDTKKVLKQLGVDPEVIRKVALPCMRERSTW